MAKLSHFAQKTLAILKKIPSGRVTTYASLARAIGYPKSYRAVGNVLNKNSYAPIVPCHRVVKSNGQIGGYNGGTAKKIKLLKGEGIKIKKNKILDFNKVLYEFKKKIS